MPRREDEVIINGARLVFRNFAGKMLRYNAEGDRNFSVLLDPDIAEDLKNQGWNIKYLKPREEGDPEQAYLKVKVSFKNRPPTIVLISSRGRTNLKEDECELIDMMDIENADVKLSPYRWEVSGKSGTTAYLSAIYVTIYEDELMLKYSDIPEVGARERQYREEVEA